MKVTWERYLVRHEKWNAADRRYHLHRTLEPGWIIVGRIWETEDGQLHISPSVSDYEKDAEIARLKEVITNRQQPEGTA